MNLSEYSGAYMEHRRHLSVIERLFALLAWFVAGAILLTVGWLAMAPDDPQGAVSLLSRRQPGIMFLESMALAAVAAVAATVIAGRLLTDVGTFAVAVGLGAVSLQGGTASYLFWEAQRNATMTVSGLASKLIAESLSWNAVVLVSLMVSGCVVHWLRDRRAMELEGEMLWAASDIPIGRSSRTSAQPSTTVTAGLKHTVIATLIGIFAVAVLSSGVNARSVTHGQSCFIVAAAMWMATVLAFRMAPVRSALWSVIALIPITILAYGWAAMFSSTPAIPVNLPPSHFLRILPIQFVSVGAAVAISTSWSVVFPRATTLADASQKQSPR